MRSFDDFKLICEGKAPKSPRKPSGEAAAQKSLDDALRAQAEASVVRGESGKAISKLRPYYLQNNPVAGAMHRIKMQAAGAAVTAAQNKVTMAQQKKAAALQAKAAAKQPEASVSPEKEPEENSAATAAPKKPEAAIEAPKPALSPEEEQKAQKKKEHEQKAYRKTINTAQRSALDNKFA